MKCARVTCVVEPWYLGAGKDAPGAKEFMEMKAVMEAKHGIKFFASIGEMPAATGPTCALIAGRTADNPKFFGECVAKGCKFIYLEKPGAPSVGELEKMKADAAERGAEIFLGYNKNVTDYVTKARAFEAATPGATTTFIHNNAYKPEELGECFSRNAEGMCVHGTRRRLRQPASARPRPRLPASARPKALGSFLARRSRRRARCGGGSCSPRASPSVPLSLSAARGALTALSGSRTWRCTSSRCSSRSTACASTRSHR